MSEDGTGDATGEIDPERAVELLWGAHEPDRPGLSLGRIVAAAIEVADAEGLGALTMRKVAERFGTTTMSPVEMSAGNITGPDRRPDDSHTVVASTLAVDTRPINRSSDHTGAAPSIIGSTDSERRRWPVVAASSTRMTTTTPCDVRLR